jgi:hypothetical protein
MLNRKIHDLTYLADDVRNIVRPEDFWTFAIKENTIEQITEEIADKFASRNQRIEEIKKSQLNGKNIFTTKNIYDTLTIRLSSKILIKSLGLEPVSRQKEVKQIYNVINNESNKSYIFRTDISSFFESLPFREIISDLYNENRITKTTFNHLEDIRKKTNSKTFKGLPRGLSTSSVLSEYSLQNFDNLIRQEFNFIYYTRYVDDILLILPSQIDPTNFISQILPFNLKINRAKTYFEKIGENKKIEFLGYAYDLKEINKTTIAKKKIDKIKYRLVLSINKFANKDQNFKLLLKRLKFLSGYSKLRISGRAKKLGTGIGYQYNACDEKILLLQLKDLDQFYRKILFSKKYHLTKKLMTKISKSEFENLLKISFIGAYKNNISHSYKPQDAKIIVSAWKYV